MTETTQTLMTFFITTTLAPVGFTSAWSLFKAVSR